MAERCEVCGGPVVARCAGLDVPQIGFCTAHAREHERECQDLRDGRSWMHWITATEDELREARHA